MCLVVVGSVIMGEEGMERRETGSLAGGEKDTSTWGDASVMAVASPSTSSTGTTTIAIFSLSS